MEKVATLVVLGSLIAVAAAALFASSGITPVVASPDTTYEASNTTGTAITRDDVTSAQSGQQGGADILFVKLGCTACHSVWSLGIEGGDRGPDLSRAYLRVAAWYGVRPPLPSEEADEAVARFLLDPPSWAPTMRGVVSSLKSAYGEDYERIYVPGLVRALREAAEEVFKQCGGGPCPGNHTSGIDDWHCCRRGPMRHRCCNWGGPRHHHPDHHS